jgi:hypothetical protein
MVSAPEGLGRGQDGPRVLPPGPGTGLAKVCLPNTPDDPPDPPDVPGFSTEADPDMAGQTPLAGLGGTDLPGRRGPARRPRRLLGMGGPRLPTGTRQTPGGPARPETASRSGTRVARLARLPGVRHKNSVRSPSSGRSAGSKVKLGEVPDPQAGQDGPDDEGPGPSDGGASRRRP